MAARQKIDILWSALWCEASYLEEKITDRPKCNSYSDLLEEQTVCIEMLRTINNGNRIVSPSSFEVMAREYSTGTRTNTLHKLDKAA